MESIVRSPLIPLQRCSVETGRPFFVGHRTVLMLAVPSSFENGDLPSACRAG